MTGPPKRKKVLKKNRNLKEEFAVGKKEEEAHPCARGASGEGARRKEKPSHQREVGRGGDLHGGGITWK